MDSAKSTFLFLALVFVVSASAEGSVDPTCGSRSNGLSVIPIYGRCSPFNAPKPELWAKTIMDMASRDTGRAQYLMGLGAQNTTGSASIASGQQVLNIGNYVVRAQIGTPGQLMFMVLDTSSDHAWVPCSGCGACGSTTYSPNTSSTYSPVGCSNPECTRVLGPAASCPVTTAGSSGPCRFNQSYGGDSSLSANLVKDTLALGDAVIGNYTFGCIDSVSGPSVPPQGLLGLGRGSGPLSSGSGVFSYCLPSFKSYYFSGSLRLGPLGQPKNIKTTPLLKSPHRPSLYYVNLTGISVGRVQVVVPAELLQFDPVSGSGTIVDSGTVITRFAPGIYNAVREEYRRQVEGPFSSVGAFDTCFSVRHEAVAPSVTLHFTGLDLVLPLENTLIHSSVGSVACLAMAAGSVGGSLNIIANLQQQNMRILFDVANSRLGIARELCN